MNLPAPGPAAGLAIIGDGSGLRGTGTSDHAAVRAALSADARLLNRDTALKVFPIVVAARDETELGTALRVLPDEVTTVFLARTDPRRARAVQREMARTGGALTILEQDTTGIALAAAVVVALRRRDVAPASGRVVVAGADLLPSLVPLLTALGVGEVVSWRKSDGIGYPPPRIIHGATAVIDLRGTTSTRSSGVDGEIAPEIITAHNPETHLLALPGLLHALRSHPEFRFASDSPVQLEISRVCALALAALTPTGRLQPDLAGLSLTRTVSLAVADALKATAL